MALLALASPARADVYRCTDADGTTTFSQTSCTHTAKLISVDSANSASDDSIECLHAEHFSRSASGLMRRGLRKEETIAEYSGPDATTGGAQRLINYVYLYRETRSISHDRVVELTTTKCETGALGNVGCATLPASWIEAGGGCEGRFSAQAAEAAVNVFARHNNERAERIKAEAKLRSTQNQKTMNDYKQRSRVQRCRQQIQSEIYKHDSAIQGGSDPNGHRLALRRLREYLRIGN